MRWETHTHTSEASACATASAADMAWGCKKQGYDGMFITDHFFHGNTCIDRSLPWNEWVRRFSLGYYHAKEVGDQIGLRVCCGWEYSWNGNDFLTYGLDFQWLAAHPETATLSPHDYLKLIRASGGMLVHAHPFRQESYVKFIRLIPDMVDAVEVYNAGNRENSFNTKAEWYAKTYHLPSVSGSDAHRSDFFTGGFITDFDIQNGQDYKQMLQSNADYHLIRNGIEY